MPPTWDDLTKVTLDHYLCSPERAGEMLHLAFESGDSHAFSNLLAELTQRGISPDQAMTLLREAHERHETFWNYFADPSRHIVCGCGSEIKSPIPFRKKESAS